MPAVCYVCSLSTTTKLFFLFIIHEHTMCIIDPGIPSTQNFFFFLVNFTSWKYFMAFLWFIRISSTITAIFGEDHCWYWRKLQIDHEWLMYIAHAYIGQKNCSHSRQDRTVQCEISLWYSNMKVRIMNNNLGFCVKEFWTMVAVETKPQLGGITVH